jgi:lipopolysaccharide export LptBFGC system permease protein LptF
MLKKFSKTDIIMLFLAFLCLIFSELMWFGGEKEGALFVGLWVPSILGFAIYLKLLKIENK